MAEDPIAPLMDLPGVADSVEQAREAVDRLLGHRVLRQASSRVSAESALRGARSSAALEGHGHPLSEIRAGHVDDPYVSGALRVTAEVGALVELWQRAPRQALARLHLVAARDIVPGEGDAWPDLGRPRVAPEVSVRLDALSALLSQPVGRGGTGVPAVVLGAVVHGELLALDAFPAANGIVARGAERLTLVARGLDPKALSIPELGHLEQGFPEVRSSLEDGAPPASALQAYAEDAAAFAAGTPDGVGAWIVRCARAVALGARESLAVCESIQRG